MTLTSAPLLYIGRILMNTGLMYGGEYWFPSRLLFVISCTLQSLLMKSHIPIVASQHQVTMNNPAGRKQRIVFDLSVLYPTPDIPGSELSFEEVLLARAGWLDERPAPPSPTPPQRVSRPRDDNSRPSPAPAAPRLEVFRENNENMPQKLVIHRDVAVPLDENGAPIKQYPKEGRPKKKKVMEVNETQISK